MGSELADNFRISDTRPYILDVHIFTLFLKGYMLKISNNRTLWRDIMQFISRRGAHVIFRWGGLVPGTDSILALVWPIRFK